MEPRNRHSPLSCRIRRLLLGANMGIIFLLALAIFGMVNYLSLHYYTRLHWNRVQIHELSEKSQLVLESIAEDLHIIALLRPSNEAHDNTAALLREYAAATPSISVEFVDPDRDLARTEQLVRHYRLVGAESIVFDIGGRHRAVDAADLVEY